MLELAGATEAMGIAGIVFGLVGLAGLVIATIAVTKDAQQRGMRNVVAGVGTFWGLMILTAIIAALYKVPPMAILTVWGSTSFVFTLFGVVLYLLIRKTPTCEWGHPLEFVGGMLQPCRVCARERQRSEMERKHYEELVHAITQRVATAAAPEPAVAPSGVTRATQPISVAPPTFARLFVVDGPMRGREFPVNSTGPTRIGRAAPNDIMLAEDSTVSTEHAVIKVEGGKYMLWDLASSNGTFIYPAGSSWKDEKAKIQIREPKALMDKDVIEVGKIKMTFSVL